MFCLRLINSVIAVLLLTSCVSKKPAFEPAGEVLDAENGKKLAAALYRRAHEITSLRCLAQVKVAKGEHSDRFRQAFVLQRPDRLRMEILPQQAFYALALMVAKDGNVTVLDNSEKVALQGALNPRSVKRVLGVPLSYDELFALLTGRLPPYLFSGEDMMDAQNVEFLKAAGSYYVSTADNSFVAEIDQATLLTKRVSMRSKFNDSEVINSVYSDLEQYPAGSSTAKLPIYTRLTLSLPERVTAQMKLSSVTLDKSPDENLFEVDIPEDYSSREF